MTLDEKSFQNFGEYLYYAYANLEMLHYALKADKPKMLPHDCVRVQT